MSTRTSHPPIGSETPSSQQLDLRVFVSSGTHDWFELIQPYIRYRKDVASGEELCRIAKIHARQVLSRTELAVELNRVVWKADSTMNSSHGTYSAGDGRHVITLSMLSLQRNGWAKLMETVRHELVHAWQQEQVYREKPTETDIHDHPSFEQWMDVLDIRKGGPAVTDSRYMIECDHCGRVKTYACLCEDVRTVVETEARCDFCGADSNHLLAHDLEADDPLRRTDLPPEPVLSVQFRLQIENGEINESLVNCTGELPRRFRRLYRELQRVEQRLKPTI
ncbi:SprT-like domain-containing protein [Halopenitus sp. H-Gu1]|uniref:SprT-like domain-containing protein n=1 Tax=Halopenitus sp. H-Gu1 TaxID=3242697 RepID=UPI00359DA316